MTALRSVICSVLALCVVLLSGQVARADEPRAAPWDRGVSAEQRQEADALFNEGVELHKRLLFDQALSRYREALARWDHPTYHWNAYLALSDLGRYLDAYADVEAAMKWGADAFDAAEWQEMNEHRRTLLEEHLAVIEVRCDQPDAAIVIDGKPWFVGPGTERRVVLPGEHIITANKGGYFKVVKPITVLAGKQGAVTVIMDRDGTYEKRRWGKTWMPWAVVGAGAGVTLAGGILAWRAGSDFAAADSAFETGCGQDPTCDPGAPSAYGRAQWERKLAIGAFIAGGLIVGAGGTLVVLNQARYFRTEDRNRSRFDLVPMVLDGGAGMSGRLRF